MIQVNGNCTHLVCFFCTSAPYEALVVKASGLAAGKGVVVASDRVEACAAVRESLVERKFGAAGDNVIVEELLDGPEVSVSIKLTAYALTLVQTRVLLY